MVWSSKAELTKNKESWVFQVVLEGQGFWEMGTFRKALRIYHFADINNWRNDLQLQSCRVEQDKAPRVELTGRLMEESQWPLLSLKLVYVIRGLVSETKSPGLPTE